uniref:Thiamine biosynthesis ThiH family protein n=1 Tax=uncultured marine thaumarchaeote SAT1000_05_G10 TaxID=1456358 RepID=A0A075I4F4_9ARCH|nr:thiamine biosynthesis ThiH family protein [uncultured marine thaumarchaeote SAT1000_05_G10]
MSRLKEAGLQSLPGAGAEILTDQVKDIISPKKLRVMNGYALWKRRICLEFRHLQL